MSLMAIPDCNSTLNPNRVDDTRYTRRSVITALEARVFHTPDAHGMIITDYLARDNVPYRTRFKLTPAGIICPCCGEPCDELRLQPSDRGLCCVACIQRHVAVAKAQARTPAQAIRQAAAPRKAVRKAVRALKAQPAPQAPPRRCGAKTKSGTPCQHLATLGSDRCKSHRRKVG